MQQLLEVGGFIGTHLMQELEDRNIDTHGISLTTNSIDVTKWDDVQQIPPKDLLFHLAGITNIPRSFEAPREVLVLEYQDLSIDLLYMASRNIYQLMKNILLLQITLIPRVN